MSDQHAACPSDEPSHDPHATIGCHVCGAPCGDDGGLCRTHSQRLASDLETVAELLVELETSISRQNRGRRDGSGGKSAERPLPYDPRCSGVHLDVTTTISAWCVEISRRGEDERDPLRAVDPHDHAGTAAWLARNLDRLRHHPDAGQGYDEITDAVAQGWRAVDLAPDMVVLGECTAIEDPEGNPLPEPCRTVVYSRAGAHTARCRGCGGVHVVAQRREWMIGYLATEPFTTGECARLLSYMGKAVGASTVRAWAAQGKLTAQDEDGRGHPRYLMGDVVRLAFGIDDTDQSDTRPAGAA